MAPKPKGGGNGAGRPRRDRPSGGGASSSSGRGRPGGRDEQGGSSRDARRAADVSGGKTARDARRAEGGRKGNKPRDPSKPDPRGEGYWGDQRGPEYWKARKAAAKAGKPFGPNDGKDARGDRPGGAPGGRRSGPPSGARSEQRRPSGPRGDRDSFGDDRPRRSAAPPLPPEFRNEGQLLYGRNAVHEALRADRREIRGVWATPATVQAEEWLEGVDVVTVDSDALTALAGSTDHQGVVAAADPYPYVELDELLAHPNPLIIALDEVQDPQNLGAIARTAECVGATGMIICRHRAAEVTPSAAKASAGAVEHLPIAQVRNLADALTAAKAVDCWVYGAAGDEPDAVAYDTPDYTGGVVLVMGAEGTGLRTRVTDTCDALVSLPLRGSIDSLNVGAASAVLLYAILQQRDRLDTGS